jgi:hypothetical protein
VGDKPRIFRIRQTRTGNWVGEQQGQNGRLVTWTRLFAGPDPDVVRADVLDGMVRRRGFRVQFEGEDEIHG